MQTWTQVRNESDQSIGLEYVSSFCLAGLMKEAAQPWDQVARLHVPHNGTYGELQWKAYSLPELGLRVVSPWSTIKRLSYCSTGAWPCSTYLPMGCLQNTQTGSILFWQIEAMGSWHWEIGNTLDHLYLALSGPTQNESHWWKALAPKETFVTVPAAIGSVCGGLDDAFAQLTQYRRRLRRPHHDNDRLHVIFDDYMNCLFAEQTTEKLLPLIDIAADLGCEIFCIDAGWYGDEYWYDQVGLWQPSEARFPGGFAEPMDYIRSKGMTAGLWIEPEMMSTGCPKAAQAPDDWFFMRRGRRAIDHGRYQLDFRNPQVIAYIDKVIDRLVGDYGLGYFKFDYNMNAGLGTQTAADSFGDGLVQHHHAYLAWLDSVLARYPDMIIENCASGGMRLVQPLLSRHPIHSISDQTDYHRFAPISAAAPTALPPEQTAVWSYPIAENSRDAVVFNMVNSLLVRIYLSGRPDQLSTPHFELVREAIAYHKTIRSHTKNGIAFWPLGLPSFDSPWISMGLRCDGCDYLAVWRVTGGPNTCNLPIAHLMGRQVRPHVGYPKGDVGACQWHRDAGVLSVTLPNELSARVIELHRNRDVACDSHSVSEGGGSGGHDVPRKTMCESTPLPAAGNVTAPANSRCSPTNGAIEPFGTHKCFIRYLPNDSCSAAQQCL